MNTQVDMGVREERRLYEIATRLLELLNQLTADEMIKQLLYT